MKKTLLPLAFLCLAHSVSAQQDIFALTGKDSPQIIFNDFRSLDVKAGVSGTAFLTDQTAVNVFSQNLNSNFKESRSSVHNAQTPSMASLAFDASGNDLVYIPMFSSNVYVLNANSRKVTLVENNAVKSTSCDIGSHITRMTTGADGNIYALTNSGSQLIKISKKNGKYSVSDLGKISDAAGNLQNSLAVVQTGFGGDMIADANGDLYVLSASANVFRISLKNLTSELVGKITGLPENYSLNGAAVNNDGKVMIASAKGDHFYEVNFENLQASQVNNDLKLHIYDLASKYLVNDKSRVTSEAVFAGADVYPTKVKDSFYVNLGEKTKGQATVELYNAGGMKVLSKVVNASDRNSSHLINIGKMNQGLYIVNVKDESGKQILSKKIIVE